MINDQRSTINSQQSTITLIKNQQQEINTYTNKHNNTTQCRTKTGTSRLSKAPTAPASHSTPGQPPASKQLA
jgi:hypothetical protein